MDEILKAAIAFESLFNIEYKIIIGRKGKVDFTAMNTKLTLLYKKKIDKTKRKSIIQLDKISVKEDENYIN